MCINSLQNIKAVATKLWHEIAGQTMYLYPDGRTTGGRLICSSTLRRGGIKSKNAFIAVLHFTVTNLLLFTGFMIQKLSCQPFYRG